MALTVQTTKPARNRVRRLNSDRNVCRIGSGSAIPDVSITTRRNGFASSRRRVRSCNSVELRSERTVQQTQPLASTTVSSE